MYRRLPIRLLCLALFTFFTLPAFAQYTRDNAASKKIDEAINEHYLATDFDKAEGVLTGTITACAEKCSPAVLAKAWMYVGIVRGSGKNDQSGAKEAFQKALSTDPGVKLDTQLATPETQKTFEGLGGAGAAAPTETAKPAPAAAANEDAGDKGGLKCTPDVRELQTRRPIPMECTSDEEVASMEIRYKPFGGDAWKSVKMKKVNDAFRGEVPCDATGAAGTLKVYVRAKDASGESVDSFGSKAKPVEFTTSESSSMEPPSYPGEAAPTRCVAKEECPPDFPGCGAGALHGNKDAGASCSSSRECKEGLLCSEGTCEAAPSCETNADCTSGSCVDNKCAAPEDEAPVATYKKNWIGLHFAQDIAIMGGTNVCGADARTNQGYACYESGSSTAPYNGDPYPGAGIATGTVVATRRLLVSFDRAFMPNLTVGARVGFAFSGGPPAGKAPDSQDRGGESAGTKFLPFHVELRAQYWFGKGVLGKKGLRPYVHVGGGIAQVDGKVKVKVADCPNALFSAPSSDSRYATEGDQCAAGVGTHTTTPYELDAWRKMGQGFITLGGGAVYAFKENIGAQLNVNLMYMLPTSGPVIQPSLGVVYGF
ncbi:MAG: hypothetical protein ABUL62_05220 [Myxococcales bacterium]